MTTHKQLAGFPHLETHADRLPDLPLDAFDGHDDPKEAPMRSKTLWTFAITSTAVFMTTLDNLVVTTALPVIRTDLHATPAGE